MTRGWLNFNKVQYADDTTIYRPVRNLSDNVSAGIEQAMAWSETNNMISNNDKTLILNVAFSDREGMNDPLPYHCADIVPSKSVKFLEVL